MKINIDNENVLEDITDEEENIYQKLARATARAVDINLGKTTLADLLDGYTKSITLQQKIDKAIEEIKKVISIIKEQPSSCELNDIWTLEYLNSFLKILGDGNNE